MSFRDLLFHFLHQPVGRFKAGEKLGALELEVQQVRFHLFENLRIIGPALESDRPGGKRLELFAERRNPALGLNTILVDLAVRRVGFAQLLQRDIAFHRCRNHAPSASKVHQFGFGLTQFLFGFRGLLVEKLDLPRGPLEIHVPPHIDGRKR